MSLDTWGTRAKAVAAIIGAIAAIGGAFWWATERAVEYDTVRAAPAAVEAMRADMNADHERIEGHVEAHHDSLVNKATVDTLHAHIHAIRRDQAHQRQLDSMQNAAVLREFTSLKCQMRGETGC